MSTLREVIETRLPQAQAFTFIADFANASRWDPGIADSEAVDDEPVGPGKRYRLGVRMQGRVSPMEYVITEFEAPTRVVLRGEGSGVRAEDAINFEPGANGGTRITYVADIRLTGLMGLAQPFLGGPLAKIARDAMNGMRDALNRLADTR
jgi:carbon monoxide dehydrogenase subunit G